MEFLGEDSVVGESGKSGRRNRKEILILDFRGASVSAAASCSAQVAGVSTDSPDEDPLWGRAGPQIGGTL
ncbi:MULTISPECIES: hypothetical protein [Streptomyces]|uniref:hypothetical protein n=1 Tax=Streptomyces TaxID=1883 RepID=UPI000B0FECD9|nr:MULTISPECIES: hypothetical protein [Streptomyces]MDI5908991.1 hypothetical protein [Streptomyces sp. 12257]